MGRGERRLLLCDPRSELRLGGREKRRAKIITGMELKKVRTHERVRTVDLRLQLKKNGRHNQSDNNRDCALLDRATGCIDDRSSNVTIQYMLEEGDTRGHPREGL